MKSRLAPLFLAVILVFAPGGLTASGQGEKAKGAKRNGPRSGVVVLGAFFGANISWLDVTDKLQQLVDGSQNASVTIDGATFGDPAPGYAGPVSFVARFLVDDKIELRAVYRGDKLEIPRPASGRRRGAKKGTGRSNNIPNVATGEQGLEILAATFGANVSWLDVTDKLKEVLDQSDSNVVHVNAATFGDPHPGYAGPFSFVVRYQVNGKTEFRAVYRDENLKFPDIKAAAAMPRGIVELPFAVTAMAFDPESGMLATVNMSAPSVRGYPREFFDGASDKIVGPAKTGWGPHCIVHKRVSRKSYFVVGALDEAVVDILDASSLAPVKRISLPGTGVGCLAASVNAADPYVYYCTMDKQERSPNEHRLGRIDLDKLADEGFLNASALSVSVAGDGRILYLFEEKSLSYAWSAYEVAPKDEGGGLWLINHGNASPEPILANPNGQSVIMGTSIYTSDLQTNLGNAPLGIDNYIPGRPMLVGFNPVVGGGVQLAFYSLNSRERLGGVLLPEEFYSRPVKSSGSPTSNMPATPPFQPSVFADLEVGRVLVTRGNLVLPVQLGPLELPLEPSLEVIFDSPLRMVIGEKNAIQFRLEDPKAKATLIDGPEGMTLAGGELRWTPPLDLGAGCNIELEVSQGTVSSRKHLRLPVSPPQINLGFRAQGFNVSPDGKWGVVWSQVDHDGASLPTGNLALIDFARRRIAVHAIAEVPTLAIVDGDRIYVAAYEPNAAGFGERSWLSALDHKFAVQKRFDLPGQPSHLSLDVPGRLVVYAGGESLGISTKDLKLLAPPSEPLLGMPASTEIPRLLPDGLYFRGVVYDRSFSKVRLLFRPAGAWAYEALNSSFNQQGAVRLLSPWDALQQPNGSLRVEGDLEAVSPDFPAMASLRDSAVHEEAGSNFDFPQPSSVLGFKHVATNVEWLSLPITIFARDHSTGEPPLLLGQKAIQWRDNAIFAFCGDRVYTIALSDERLRKLAEPFGFRMVQDKLVVNANGHDELKHQVRGASGAVRYELIDLAIGLKGLSIDEKTGTIAVDGPALQASLLASEPTTFSYHRAVIGDDINKDVEGKYKDWLTRMQAEFESFVGRPAKGVPVFVPIRLQASDESGAKAALNYYVYIETTEEEWRRGMGHK